MRFIIVPRPSHFCKGIDKKLGRRLEIGKFERKLLKTGIKRKNVQTLIDVCMLAWHLASPGPIQTYSIDILRRTLKGQRHDRVQTESQELQLWRAVSTCWFSSARCSSNRKLSNSTGWVTDRLLNPNGNDLRWNSNPNFAGWSMPQTRTPKQWAKSRMSCRCRGRERADRQKLSRRRYMA